MATFKAQSAMEYLMTYGWAILIIAVVMVALFSLGIFNPSFGTNCIPQSGYECTGAVFASSSGAMSATIGQTTGTSWTTTNIIFLPQGVSTSSLGPGIFTPAGNYVAVSGGLQSGQTVQLTIPVNVPEGSHPVSVGSTTAGTLWAQYTTASTSGFLYAEVATVTLKAS